MICEQLKAAQLRLLRAKHICNAGFELHRHSRYR